MYKNAKEIRQATEVKADILRLLKGVKTALKPGEFDNIIMNLEREGFFIKPSSIKYHNTFTGGLAKHSLAVYLHLDNLYRQYLGGLNVHDKKNLLFIALFHDLCKLDDYYWDKPNQQWAYVTPRKQGHALRSLAKLEEWGIEVEPLVAECIKYHMGAYERTEYNWSMLSDAQDKEKLVLVTHIADMLDAKGVDVR